MSFLLKCLVSKYAFFDQSIKDSSRFFFGNKNAQVFYNSGRSILSDLDGQDLWKRGKKQTFVLETQAGERNDTLFKVACAFKSKGLDQEIVKIMIKEINANLSEPMENKEIEKIIKSAFSYEKLNRYMIYEEAMKYFDEKHIVIKVGSKTVVLDKSTYEMQDYRNASLFYANKKIKIKSINAKGKTKEKIENAFDSWFMTTDKRFERLVFNPSNQIDINEYNLWTGFKYEGTPTGSCEIYLDHIKKNICNNEMIIYNFVLDWMAQAIQEPEKRPGIAIALRGEQGVGKGVFANTFGNLFGKHYLYVNDVYSLTNHFNGHLANKLLVFADEAIWGGDKRAESTLKSLISEPQEIIEYKGKDAVRMNNYKRIIFATNNDWVVPVDRSDRRYVVLDVANNNMKDREYFGGMIEEMKEGGYEKLMYFLQNRDISKRDWSKSPVTEAKVDNIVFGFNAVGKWIYCCLEKGNVSKNMLNNWNIFADQQSDTNFILKTEDVFELFDNYISTYRMGGKYIDERSVGIWLSKMIGVVKIKKQVKKYRGYYYCIPAISECRNRFNEYVKYDLFKNEY